MLLGVLDEPVEAVVGEGGEIGSVEVAESKSLKAHVKFLWQILCHEQSAMPATGTGCFLGAVLAGEGVLLVLEIALETTTFRVATGGQEDGHQLLLWFVDVVEHQAYFGDVFERVTRGIKINS